MPVFNQDPKIKEGAEVLVLDSLEEMPEQVKDGTFLVVPRAKSEDSGESESGESGTKVIDFTNYAFEDGLTFNDAILSLFANNGNLYSNIDTTTFWADLTTDKQILFVFDISAMAEGQTVEASPSCILKENGTPVNVGFNMIMLYNGVLMRFTVFFNVSTNDNTQYIDIRLATESMNSATS